MQVVLVQTTGLKCNKFKATVGYFVISHLETLARATMLNFLVDFGMQHGVTEGLFILKYSAWMKKICALTGNYKLNTL